MHFKALLAALLLSALLPVAHAEEEEAPPPQAQYVELKPSFVGTLGSGPRIQYLKADVALRTDDPAAVEKLRVWLRLNDEE